MVCMCTRSHFPEPSLPLVGAFARCAAGNMEERFRRDIANALRGLAATGGGGGGSSAAVLVRAPARGADEKTADAAKGAGAIATCPERGGAAAPGDGIDALRDPPAAAAATAEDTDADEMGTPPPNGCSLSGR